MNRNTVRFSQGSKRRRYAQSAASRTTCRTTCSTKKKSTNDSSYERSIWSAMLHLLSELGAEVNGLESPPPSPISAARADEPPMLRPPSELSSELDGLVPLPPSRLPEPCLSLELTNEPYYERSISSAMLRSPRELSPELGGLESPPSSPFTSWGTTVRVAAIFRRSSQIEMLGQSPPSTCTSPCSLHFPSNVPTNFESSSFLLCFFLSAGVSS